MAVVIGGSTFTFGPGAHPTTEVYNRQTVTIGLNGMGFKTTTFTDTSATQTSKKENSVKALRARKRCMAFWEFSLRLVVCI